MNVRTLDSKDDDSIGPKLGRVRGGMLVGVSVSDGAESDEEEQIEKIG
jgi:hypothetical protein